MSEKLISAEHAIELERLYNSRLIIVCAMCKAYIGGHGEEISFGVCRECAQRNYRANGRTRRVSQFAMALGMIFGMIALLIWAYIHK